MKRLIKPYPSYTIPEDEQIANNIEQYIITNYDYIDCKYWGMYPIGKILTVEVNDFYDKSSDTFLQFKSVNLPKEEMFNLWEKGQKEKVCNIIIDNLLDKYN